MTIYDLQNTYRHLDLALPTPCGRRRRLVFRELRARGGHTTRAAEYFTITLDPRDSKGTGGILLLCHEFAHTLSWEWPDHGSDFGCAYAAAWACYQGEDYTWYLEDLLKR